MTKLRHGGVRFTGLRLGRLTGAIAGTAVAIVSIFMVVGGVVIMNIMLAVVTERTHEIGIRKSWARGGRDILQSVPGGIVDAGGVGGFIGVVLRLDRGGHGAQPHAGAHGGAGHRGRYRRDAVGRWWACSSESIRRGAPRKLDPIEALRAEK